jgi:hypothetical protein
MNTMGNLISVFGSVGIRRRGVIVFTALILIAASGPFAKAVRAAFIGDLITVVATNEQGSAEARVPMPLSHLPPQAKVPEHVRWMLAERFDLETEDGTVIGTIDDLTVELDGDPVASISFTATAGSSDTTFSLSSATVGFPALTNPPASADAELTLTDVGSDGVSVSVVSPPNSGLFKSVYNGSSAFSELLGNISISGGSTTIMGDSSGTIAGSVSSIQAVWTFKLSANDQVSGAGTFEVVIPEPSTLLLASFAVCGLFLKLR